MNHETLISRASIAYLLILVEIASVIALEFTLRDDSYYLVCSLFNAIIIFSLPYASRTNLIIDFRYINFAALLIQCFGFFSYWYDVPVLIYNYLIHLISLLQLLRLLIIRKGDADGYREDHYWGVVVRHFNFNLSKIMLKKKKL